MWVVRVTMGSNDTNFKGDYWFRQYRTMGEVVFEEMTIPRSEVRKGDVIFWGESCQGWCHVAQVFTSNRQFRNFRAGYGIMSPKDPSDFRNETKISVGGMSWTMLPSDEMITVRRPV